ncbi:MAG: PQQ-binding-like beta-propeller repeat protein [Singulisphaera sp.]
MKRFSLLIGLLLVWQIGAAPVPRMTNDWPAWRGAQRNGISRERGLLTDWPEGGPRLAWQAAGLGIGFSTPAVADGRVFLMGNRDKEEVVVALSARDSGKELWSTTIGPVRHDGAGYPGPRSTPTVDGDHVYVLGLNGDLVCLNAKTGAGLWRHNLVSDFGGAVPNWGYSESVLVDGPWVLCTPGGSEATIVALDKASGAKVWGAKVGDPAHYSSIIKADIGGVKQYLQFTAKGVIAVKADDGTFLWRYDAPANGTANCATAVCVDNMVFAASGYGTGGGLVEVKNNAGKFDAQQSYFTKHMKNHHGGYVVVDGYLYGCDDPGILTCLDLKTGEVKWADRSSGKCSLVCVDGLLYCRSEAGLVSLVAAKPSGFELHGRFEQPERSDAPSWPHPVVADGRLYLRDQDKLLVYDVRK